MRRLGLSIVVLASFCVPSSALELFVAPNGDDTNPGTKARPFATVTHARDGVRELKRTVKRPVTVYIRGGIYYLDEPLVFTAEDSGSREAPVCFVAYEGERPVFSGGLKLELRFKPFRNGIFQANVPAARKGKLNFTQLFVNGRRQHLARYPNFAGDNRYNGPGCSADALSPRRVKRWKNPTGGFVHGLSSHRWGSLHYRITGADKEGNLRLQGGEQINRSSSLHKQYRFVENIFEELDAPGEWYLDSSKGVLYLIPPKGVDISKARVEAVVLRQLVEFRGSMHQPVRNIHLCGLTLTHTAHTVLEKYEPLLRGDWSIVRAGAVFFEGAEDCSVQDCFFDAVGGNGVFISNYNRRIKVTGCKFTEAGDSAICLVGDFDAVRNGSTWQNHIPDPPDKTVGPRTPNYPALCVIHNNLIRNIGIIGKQTAGVFLSMAAEIIVSHNTIYHIPRAGICINDGTWGGHVIEYNDVFNTVRETGDHGPFNSWGRDRHWRSDNELTRTICQLDNFKTTIIRHNRFAHSGSHSWGIDLDDGSSNYHLYNNLCLGMSFKLREGFFRLVENNICIGPTPPGLHVWYEGCDDVIRRNIIVNTEGTDIYEFIRCNPAYARQFDYNLFYNYKGEPVVRMKGGTTHPFKDVMSLTEWRAQGLDVYSVFAEPLFIDPAKGDYRVRQNSPALKLGFKNFPMDNFGVLKPEFQAEAQEGHRLFDHAQTQVRQVTQRSSARRTWLGATIKNIVGPAEISAAGLGSETGVIFADVPTACQADDAGFRVGDVILELDGKAVSSVRDLERLFKTTRPRTVPVLVYRKQKKVTVKLVVGQ